MIHFVSFSAPRLAQRPLTDALRNLSLGFYPLDEGMSVVVTYQTATELREWLHAAGAQKVTVIRLQNEWATWDNADLAKWLQKAASFF